MTQRRKRIEAKEAAPGIYVVKPVDRNLTEPQNTGLFGEDFLTFIAEHPPSQIVFDMTNLDLIAPSVLGQLLTVNEALKKCGAPQMRFAGMRRDIKDVFGITKLGLVFKFNEKEFNPCCTVSEVLRGLGVDNPYETVPRDVVSNANQPAVERQ